MGDIFTLFVILVLSSGGQVRKSYVLQTGLPGFLTFSIQNYNELYYREVPSGGKIESQLCS